MRYFSKTDEAAVLPTRATNGSAGYDFRVIEEHWISPGETM